MPRAIGKLPTDRAVALGAGEARGADDFACSAAGSFAQKFWSWRPASFSHALAEAAYLHVTKTWGGWCLPVLLCDWARGLDGVFHLTRREHLRASARTSLRLLPFLRVRGVVVVTKFGLPVSRVSVR